MPAIPPTSDFNKSTIDKDTFHAKFLALHAYLTGLLASSGNAVDARSQLGLGSAATAEATAFAKTLLDDVDAATARKTLEVGALTAFKSNGFAAGATEYMDATASYATIGNANAPLPYACTIKNLFVACAAAPGAGQTYTYTLFKNGVGQTLTCTISNTDTSASDTSNTVTFAAGDLITLRAQSSGSAASTIHRASVEVVK